MLSPRIPSIGFAGFVMLGLLTSAVAQDTRAPAADAAKTSQAPPAEKVKSFPNSGKSKQPCEVYGPCGRCDCPTTSGADKKARQ
jgi:hypothetical protein